MRSAPAPPTIVSFPLPPSSVVASRQLLASSVSLLLVPVISDISRLHPHARTSDDGRRADCHRLPRLYWRLPDRLSRYSIFSPAASRAKYRIDEDFFLIFLALNFDSPKD